MRKGAPWLKTTFVQCAEAAARNILAEIGRDMSRFPTAGHLISWAGLCSKNDESAGKRRSNSIAISARTTSTRGPKPSTPDASS